MLKIDIPAHEAQAVLAEDLRIDDRALVADRLDVFCHDRAEVTLQPIELGANLLSGSGHEALRVAGPLLKYAKTGDMAPPFRAPRGVVVAHNHAG
jgi:hypothetical protein